MIRAPIRAGLAAALLGLVPAGAAAQTGAPELGPPQMGPLPLAGLTGAWDGLRKNFEAAGLTLALQEQSELWGDVAGGRRRGAAYDGVAALGVSVDLGKVAGWQDAQLFVNAFQIHGRGPSANLVGNLQLVSSLEATRDTKLYDFWLEQKFLGGKLNLRLGQGGADEELMIADYAGLFLNSSFGFPPLAASDLPSGGPAYPLATPFVRARYEASDRFTLVGAVFNGDPAPPGSGDPQRRDAGGTAFRLDDHVLGVAELWYRPNGIPASAVPDTYKIGFWAHSGHFADQRIDSGGLALADPASTGIPRQHSPDYAVYGIANQTVWRRPGSQDEAVGLFLRLMAAPADRNLVSLFIQGGVNWHAPLGAPASDSLGLGVSCVRIGSAARGFGNDLITFGEAATPYADSETVLEATYLHQVTQSLSLQPDLQYVINPGAGIPTSPSARPPSNALVIGIRATITF